MDNTRTKLQAALAVELAKAGITQTELAMRAGWPPSTLSGWLRNVGRPPPDLPALLETALRIPRGTLGRASHQST